MKTLNVYTRKDNKLIATFTGKTDKACITQWKAHSSNSYGVASYYAKFTD